MKFLANHKIFLVFLFLLFLCLSLWFTKIPIGQIGQALPDGGDPLLVSWIWSWEMFELPQDPANLFNANIFAPFTHTLAFSEHMLGSLILAWPLFLIFKNIFLVFNLISLLSFAIAGLGMYLLVFYLTKNKLVSFLAAFIYAFAPYKIHHLEHINLSGMWLPYFFLYLEKFFSRQTWKNIWLLTLFTLLVFLNAMQYFLFLPLVAIIFLIKNILTKKFNFRQNLLKISISLLILLAVVVPISLPYLNINNQFGLTRKIKTIEGLSPDIIDYFISPLFYKYFYPIFFEEWAISPGILTILLLIFTSLFIYARSKKLLRSIHYYIIGLFGLFFSFGYYIQFTRADAGGLPGLWAFFYHLIPGFGSIRATGRYSIFFLLAAAVIIGYGLHQFFKAKKISYKKQAITVSFIIILLFIEFSFTPNYNTYALFNQSPPPVYYWLKSQSNDNIYIELPLGLNLQDKNYDTHYEFYSIHHFKRIVNGYSGYAPPEFEALNSRLISFDINHSDIEYIKDYGATHIIFHFDYYPPSSKETLTQRFNSAQTLKLIQTFDNDYIYQIL